MSDKNILSPDTRDFLNLGREHIAYIRPATLNGMNVFAVHAADGTPLAFHADRAAAAALVRQNDMEAALLH